MFMVKGLRPETRLKVGKSVAFKTHMGESGSAHQYSVKCYDNLKNGLCHIELVMQKQTNEQVMANRMRLRHLSP